MLLCAIIPSLSWADSCAPRSWSRHLTNWTACLSCISSTTDNEIRNKQKTSGTMSSAPNASGYEPMYPTDSPADATVKRFVTRFFGISDTPGLTDEWVEFFRDDATLVMGNDAATGRQQVRKLREGMWERVEARKHTLVKVFPGSFVDREFGGEENIAEFMLFGSGKLHLLVDHMGRLSLICI